MVQTMFLLMMGVLSVQFLHRGGAHKQDKNPVQELESQGGKGLIFEIQYLCSRGSRGMNVSLGYSLP